MLGAVEVSESTGSKTVKDAVDELKVCRKIVIVVVLGMINTLTWRWDLLTYVIQGKYPHLYLLFRLIWRQRALTLLSCHWWSFLSVFVVSPSKMLKQRWDLTTNDDEWMDCEALWHCYHLHCVKWMYNMAQRYVRKPILVSWPSTNIAKLGKTCSLPSSSYQLCTIPVQQPKFATSGNYEST